MDTVLIPIEYESKLNGFHLDTISHIATVNNLRIGLVHNYLPQSQCQFPKSRAFALERMKAVFSNPKLENFPHRCFVREGRIDRVIGRLEKQSHSKLIVLPVKDDVSTFMNIINKTNSTVYAIPERPADRIGLQTAVILSSKGGIDKSDLRRILSIKDVLNHKWKIVMLSPDSKPHLSNFVAALFKRYKIQLVHHEVDNIVSEGTQNFIQHLEPDCIVMKNDRGLLKKHFNTRKPLFFKEVLSKNIPVISF